MKEFRQIVVIGYNRALGGQAPVSHVVESFGDAQQERRFRAAKISKRLAAASFRFFRQGKNITSVHVREFTRLG